MVARFWGMVNNSGRRRARLQEDEMDEERGNEGVRKMLRDERGDWSRRKEWWWDETVNKLTQGERGGKGQIETEGENKRREIEEKGAGAAARVDGGVREESESKAKN